MKARHILAGCLLMVSFTFTGVGQTPHARPLFCPIANDFDLQCTTQSNAGTLFAPGVNCRNVMVDGFPRQYIVYLPTNPQFAGNHPRPVVFMTHGSSGDGPQFFRTSGWTEKADEVDLIAVFPTALQAFVLDNERCSTKWNHYGFGSGFDAIDFAIKPRLLRPGQTPLDYPSTSPWPADDIKFVDAMLNDVESMTPVDQSRVFFSGFSSGSDFAARVAIELADRFNAAAWAPGGLAGTPTPVPSRHIPVSVSLGTCDDRQGAQAGIVTFDGDRCAKGLETGIPLAPAALFTSANYNRFLSNADGFGLDRAPTSTETQTHLTSVRFTKPLPGNTNGNTLRLQVLEGVKHQYPTCNAIRCNNPFGFSAANAFWSFFSGGPGNYVSSTANVNGTAAATRNFNISSRGAASLTALDSAGATRAGYARIQPALGAITPAGLAIFGFHQNNVLVTQASVPASAPVLSGRIYAEVSETVNTGLAMVNANSQDATVDFYFTDRFGDNFRSGRTTIAAGQQIAAFLNERPFSGGLTIAGTFTFTSSAPIAVIALRGTTNERQEFLITTLPVTPIAPILGQSLLYPHYAVGGGWTTSVILVNTSDTSLTGFVQFFDQGSGSMPGQPVTVAIEGQGTGQIFSYFIAPRSSQKLVASGGSDVRVGSVRVAPSVGTLPAGLSVFSFRQNGVTVTEAGVPSIGTGTNFRLYAAAAGKINKGEIGAIQTGVALANDTNAAVTVTFNIAELDGTILPVDGTVSIPPNGQTAVMLSEIPGFQGLNPPFEGILRISSSSRISAVGLLAQINERGDYLITTTSPVNEAATPVTTELIFPHAPSGGGYTTQFVLFNSSGSGNAIGALRFVSQAGQPLELILK